MTVTLYVLNIDNPTDSATVHAWPAGQPRFSHCRERKKAPEAGGWRRFRTYTEARQCARDSGNKVYSCKMCRRDGTLEI